MANNIWRVVKHRTCVFVVVCYGQEDAPVVKVRLRVVRLLGHLGGQMNRSLVTGKKLCSLCPVSDG